MAKIYKSGRNTEYSVIYSGMAGVDFSGDGSEISKKRFSYLENMYRDYENNSSIIESIPGFRKIASTGSKINGIYSHKDSAGEEYLIIHAGEKLLRYAVKSIDTSDEPTEIGSLANAKSRGFNFGSNLYILDGEKITAVTAEGEAKSISDEGVAYIPTAYINGKEYEQRNLLTRSFFEEYNLGSAEADASGSKCLKYVITDEEGKKCSVASIDRSYMGEIFIPTYTKIGSSTYKVTEIADRAFQGAKNITSVFISGGVVAIGKFAFANCSSLTKVTLPECTISIGNAAFDTCYSLSDFHIGKNMKSFGNSAFSMCTSLKNVTYSGTAQEFNLIENKEVIGNITLTPDTVHHEISLSIPIFSPAASIEKLTAGNTELTFTEEADGGLVKSIRVYFSDRANAVGLSLKIQGTLSEDGSLYKNRSGFLASALWKGGSPSDLISKCRVSACFDGRVFLAGNPDYPNAVFFSSLYGGEGQSDLHFGDMNYFSDGVGPYNTRALLAAGEGLAVFKEGDGGGSIFYHTPHDTGIDIMPKIYPASFVHSGICAKGDVISFFDDPVFISEGGLSALDKQNINLDRSIATRSHNINPKLLTENLEGIRMAIWQGYLVLLGGDGRVYLGDSRQTFTHTDGNKEYEWYFLNGIGVYEDGKRVYRYATSAFGGWKVNEAMANKRLPEDALVFRTASEKGIVHVTAENFDGILVYPTEEFRGGTFYPACEIFALGNRLFFGAENGDICLFNNDLKGKAPKRIEILKAYDEEDYRKAFEGKIHPDYYAFNDRAARYALSTPLDDGDFPHLLKSSVKRSLTLKLLTYSSAEIICEVGTDKSGFREVCRFPASSLSFWELDFSALSLSVGDSVSLSISEKEKNWVEKQVSLYSDEFCSPIGVFTIAYRFKVEGGIKKNKNF